MPPGFLATIPSAAEEPLVGALEHGVAQNSKSWLYGRHGWSMEYAARVFHRDSPDSRVLGGLPYGKAALPSAVT